MNLCMKQKDYSILSKETVQNLYISCNIFYKMIDLLEIYYYYDHIILNTFIIFMIK